MSFQSVATHPQALAQRTDTGKVLWTLGSFNNKIYAGFGDYAANTGPIALNPFDPTTLTFASTPEFSADTEAIYRFRNINGRVYIPSIDPKTGDDYTMGEIVNGKTVWTGHRPAGMTHVYDIVTMNGSDLWMIGSKGVNGIDHGQVWYSADGGATWSLSLDALPANTANDVLRFTFAAPMGGNLYVQGYEFKGGASSMNGNVTYSWVFNGSRWSKQAASGFAASSGATVFKGKVIMVGDESGGSLQTFDGKTTTTVLGNAMNFSVGADGNVYVLTSNNDGTSSVLRSSDLLSWQNVSPAPNNSRSILVDGQYIYLGTNDSKIYRANLNDSSQDTVPPTVSLVSPAPGANMTSEIMLQASAADASSISKVNFYANQTLIGTQTQTDPHATGTSKYYAHYWDGQNVPTGSTVSLTAVDYDLYGNRATSTPVQVVVNVPKIVDTSNPSLTVSSPTASSRVKKTASIKASAHDDGKIASLEIAYDGVVIATKQPTISGQTDLYASLNSPTVTRGTHKITFTATDVSGNRTTQVVTINK